MNTVYHQQRTGGKARGAALGAERGPTSSTLRKVKRVFVG